LSETFEETIISVVVGVLLGFIASIGYPLVQGRLAARSIKGRLKQEFVLIRDIIKANVDKHNYEPRGFRHEYYQSHSKEINEVVDATTWEIITNAETAFSRLGSPSNIEQSYDNALKSLNSAIERL
jgi:hypothetical protein